MCKVSSDTLLYVHTFCSIQWFRKRTVKALIRLRGHAGWSGPSPSAYALRHVFAWHGPEGRRKKMNRGTSFPTISLYVCPAKTQISLCIFIGWSESSLPAWRRFGSLQSTVCYAILIRPPGCAVWSESSVSAHVILYETMCPGSNLNTQL